MENNCKLKYCTGTLKFYEGGLGYEAFVCSVCNAHYTAEGIFPDWDKYEMVVKKYKKVN